MIKLNRFEDALQCYNKTIKLNPNNSFVYTNKGLLLVDLNKHEEAIECLDKATALNPNNVLAYTKKFFIKFNMFYQC